MIYFLISMVVLLKTIGPALYLVNQFYPEDDPFVISLFGESVFICTPSGIKYINADELR
ncbi:MAG: hypothetical protein R3D86_09695 [Emcibacteraceae bacterium]